MRHRKAGIKIGRTTSHRDAMFRNMVTSLLKHDRIRTTNTKAKELRRWADHVITLAKRGDLHARRLAMSIVREKDVVHKLFETAGDRFGEISGGYTRVVKIGRRPGDAAPMSIIELVGPESATKKRKKKKTKAAKKTAPAVTPVSVDEEAATDTPAVETADEVEESIDAVQETEESAAPAADEKAVEESPIQETTQAQTPEAEVDIEPEAQTEPAGEAPAAEEKKGQS